MGGSQLKQLKAALKTNGLTGQANSKKNKKSRTATEIRRDDREEIISNIRQQFNKFDTKTNRTKKDYTVIQGGKFVKAGTAQHNNSTRSRSMMEENLKLQYGANKSRHGKTGGVVDRRFGENNKNMTNEEKMLERFTKERERQSKKNVFSLGSDDEGDDEDDDGFVLTHYGKSLALDEAEDDNDDRKRGWGSDDEDQGLMPLEDQPQRKKTKAEVMKEVIAKSKFYKNQRQQEHQKALEDIMDLDEDFEDIMQDLNSTAAKIPKKQFLDKKPEEIEYDNKVRELTYDRRSVPADRTKTAEEIKKEHDDRMKQLETARLNRMNGIADDRDKEGDDLDDDFWNGSEEGEDSEDDEEEEEVEEEDASEDEENGNGRAKKTRTVVSMPSTHAEFVSMLAGIETEKQPAFIEKIIQVYQPRLAAGNKEKMGQFTCILLDHILYLNEPEHYASSNNDLINRLIQKLKELSEKYNEPLVESIRGIILEIQERILEQKYESKDLVFYTVVGYVFSSSDHYHLVVTPTLILMNETLSGIQYNSSIQFQQVFTIVFISEVLLKYTTFSKRIVPEALQGLEKVLLTLIPEPTKISEQNKLNTIEVVETVNTLPKSIKPSKSANSISLQTLYQENPTSQDKFELLQKTISLIGNYLEIWKETNALPEIVSAFKAILKHTVKYYSTQIKQLPELLNKLDKLERFSLNDRKPLTLQHHKALAIATFAPKFEENFNPDKKSYDANRERQEIGKIKAQLKKEKKSTLKDLRKESRFVAREQIKEKKEMYDTYHKKMASIVNSISTIEGAEKNQYEKEKQQRKSKR